MTPLDFSSTALLFLAAVLAGALIGTALAWRRLQREAAELPIWQLLRRSGAARECSAGARLREVELRCALCGTQKQCRAWIAAGGDAPPECGNASLFRAKSVGV